MNIEDACRVDPAPPVADPVGEVRANGPAPAPTTERGAGDSAPVRLPGNDRYAAYRFLRVLGLGVAAVLAAPPGVAIAQDGIDKIVGGGLDAGRYCTSTAALVAFACTADVGADYLEGLAICNNITDEDDRDECFDEARDERRDGFAECHEQRLARTDLCDLVGEDRYDPDFDAELFDDDFGNLTNPNAYFPLGVGDIKVLESEDETTVIEVRDATKLVEGVRCIVVNDRVFEDEQLIEDTDDWFAQALDGDVWYCGEESKDYEFFEGDEPELPELVSIDGSFKAGRDGDQPGVLFRGMPTPGEVYRQESKLGEAEDVAEVLTVSYGYGADPELDQFVPQELAELLCSNDCVVTREFTPLEPDESERKYYAAGIGVFLEVDPDSGEITQLVECNFDDRCEDLPEL